MLMFHIIVLSSGLSPASDSCLLMMHALWGSHDGPGNGAWIPQCSVGDSSFKLLANVCISGINILSVCLLKGHKRKGQLESELPHFHTAGAGLLYPLLSHGASWLCHSMVVRHLQPCLTKAAGLLLHQ